MSAIKRIVGPFFLAAFLITIASTSVHSQEPPQIQEIAPREAQCGTEITLTILGTYFRQGLEVIIPEGTETIYTEVISPREIEARIHIAENIPSGPRQVELIDLATGRRVSVFERGFTIVCERQPIEPLPDLVLFGADWGFAQEGRLLQILTRIRNESDAPSPGTVVYTQSATDGWWSTEAHVPALRGGDEVTITLELGIPDELRGREHEFQITVNPGNEILESSTVNNQIRLTAEIPEIPGPEVPGPEIPAEPVPDRDNDPTESAIVAIILTIIVIVTIVTVTIRRSIKARHQKEYQENSKEEDPPETCEPCTRYCQKIKLATKLTRYKIAYLSIVASSISYPEDSRENRIEGRALEGFNNAVFIYRKDNDIQQLQKSMNDIAVLVTEHMRQWLRSRPAHYDISIIGHVTGGKCKFQFYLYHCKRKGEQGVWERETKWKATIKDERDEIITTLHHLDPSEVELLARWLPELTHSLVRFAQKV